MKCISTILSFLLVSATLSLVAFSQSFTSDNNPVLDMDGEPLKINEEYSILSVLPGGGSTYLADLGNTKCPNGVVQDSSGEFDHSTPVMFFTMQLGSHYVLCVNETVWKAGDHLLGPMHPPPRFVITGGTLGIPGPNNIENWFKIEKYETGRPHSYKLRYCPSQYICPTCDPDCADVGLTYKGGYYCLSLNNKPYPFGFTKVNKNDA
ncbi:hypothetical protein R3W88_009280 [Solanum pinnatisectum]|uniref:Uncharacterized protein n=1 Tax=Solanum pinnatisectum TaxID=50273 RepID=A0AAV9MDD0_9SOLN|nr:hypothetical protein R3W88_009280 [Solanum pinnatisectum]